MVYHVRKWNDIPETALFSIFWSKYGMYYTGSNIWRQNSIPRDINQGSFSEHTYCVHEYASGNGKLNILMLPETPLNFTYSTGIYKSVYKWSCVKYALIFAAISLCTELHCKTVTVLFLPLLPPYSGVPHHIGAQGWLLSFLIFHRR
jgi:hypothetical protein